MIYEEFLVAPLCALNSNKEKNKHYACVFLVLFILFSTFFFLLLQLNFPLYFCLFWIFLQFISIFHFVLSNIFFLPVSLIFKQRFVDFPTTDNEICILRDREKQQIIFDLKWSIRKRKNAWFTICLFVSCLLNCARCLCLNIFYNLFVLSVSLYFSSPFYIYFNGFFFSRCEEQQFMFCFWGSKRKGDDDYKSVLKYKWDQQQRNAKCQKYISEWAWSLLDLNFISSCVAAGIWYLNVFVFVNFKSQNRWMHVCVCGIYISAVYLMLFWSNHIFPDIQRSI